MGSIKASRIFREAHKNLVGPGLGAGSWAGLGQDQEQLITHLSETGRPTLDEKKGSLDFALWPGIAKLLAWSRAQRCEVVQLVPL